MGHQCGAKLTKAEYMALANGRPCPRILCSNIARELEKEFPQWSPQQVYERAGQMLRESEEKTKNLEKQGMNYNLFIWGQMLTICIAKLNNSTSSSTNSANATVHGKKRKGSAHRAT